MDRFDEKIIGYESTFQRMQDSSLVQSLNFSKISFCFIVRLEFRSPSFLHINLT